MVEVHGTILAEKEKKGHNLWFTIAASHRQTQQEGGRPTVRDQISGQQGCAWETYHRADSNHIAAGDQEGTRNAFSVAVTLTWIRARGFLMHSPRGLG